MTAHWLHWIAAWVIVVLLLVFGVLVQTYVEDRRMTAEDRMTKALRTVLIVIAIILAVIVGLVFKAFARGSMG